MRKRRKLPENLSSGAIENIYIQHVDGYTDRLIDELHDYIIAVKSSDIDLNNDLDSDIEFVVDEDPLDANPACLDDLDDKNPLPLVSIFGEDPLICKDFVRFIDDFPEIDNSHYLDNDIFVQSIINSIIYDWFSDCWYKAGGWYFPLPGVLFSGAHGEDPKRLTKLTSGTYF